MQDRRENEELEFKKTTAELKQAVVSLASMLNKHGHGVVLFGVKTMEAFLASLSAKTLRATSHVP